MTKRSAIVLLLAILAQRGIAEGGGGGGGGGSQVGFLNFSMAATVLTVPPLAEPKTKVVDGFGAALLTVPDMSINVPLPIGEVAHAGKMPDAIPASQASPSPSSTPVPPSLIPAGGGGGVVLQGLTDKVAESEKTPSGSPAPRGIASTRLLSSVAARPKARGETRTVASPSETRGIASAPVDDGYIKVFRSIPATYGWDPGTVDLNDPVQPTAAAKGHKQR